MHEPDTRPATPDDADGRANLAVGWIAVTVFLLLGAALEALHLIKAQAYVDARLRREMWTLAHAHGTLLGLVNVAFGLSCKRLVGPTTRRRCGALVIAGGLLVPLGFFGGGIGNAEGDPSLAIVLVPLGAVLLLCGLSPLAIAACRRRPAG